MQKVGCPRNEAEPRSTQEPACARPVPGHEARVRLDTLLATIKDYIS